VNRIKQKHYQHTKNLESCINHHVYREIMFEQLEHYMKLFLQRSVFWQTTLKHSLLFEITLSKNTQNTTKVIPTKILFLITFYYFQPSSISVKSIISIISGAL